MTDEVRLTLQNIKKNRPVGDVKQSSADKTTPDADWSVSILVCTSDSDSIKLNSYYVHASVNEICDNIVSSKKKAPSSKHRLKRKPADERKRRKVNSGSDSSSDDERESMSSPLSSSRHDRRVVTTSGEQQALQYYEMMKAGKRAGRGSKMAVDKTDNLSRDVSSKAVR